MGSNSAREDVRRLKQLLLARPAPKLEALIAGLRLLAEVDLRAELNHISCPVNRLYGRLDALVPIAAQAAISELADGRDICFEKASHAPFISHPEQFVTELINLLDNNKKL
jgi:pimeloyl-[acyl-carrier protein] methyl ester esterase